jgi:hypothetical protein
VSDHDDNLIGTAHDPHDIDAEAGTSTNDGGTDASDENEDGAVVEHWADLSDAEQARRIAQEAAIDREANDPDNPDTEYMGDHSHAGDGGVEDYGNTNASPAMQKSGVTNNTPGKDGNAYDDGVTRDVDGNPAIIGPLPEANTDADPNIHATPEDRDEKNATNFKAPPPGTTATHDDPNVPTIVPASDEDVVAAGADDADDPAVTTPAKSTASKPRKSKS